MIRLLFAALLAAAFAVPAGARSLEQIRAFKTLSVCLPVNSLPFSSRRDDPHGFQVDLARALADRLGVMVQEDWVISPIQVLRASCDLLLDVIAVPEAQGESHLALSKPYYRSGVALVLPPGSTVTSIEGLTAHDKVAVQVGSIAAMLIGKRHVPLSTFAFEDEMLQALHDGEVTAAAVSVISAANFQHTHPDVKLVVLAPEQTRMDLVWNIAIGMRRPDPALRQAIDAAIDDFGADGTLARIYGRYGIALAPPK